MHYFIKIVHVCADLHSFPTRRSSDLHWAVTMLTTLLRSLKNQQNLCHQPSLSSHPRQLSALRLRSEEHTSELQSRGQLVCRLLLEKKKKSNKKKRKKENKANNT